MSIFLGRRAIVIGAGIAGLAAAQAIADHFDQVVVLERDELPDGAAPRAGVPQGRQPHILLAGGMRALQELFPGLGRDLAQAGAVPLEGGTDVRFEVAGSEPLPRRAFELATWSLSRPLLEWVLRCRLEGRGNIELRPLCRVLEIVGEPDDESVVAGVRCETGGGQLETLAADLVVDASGRGALSLAFLQGGRFPRPQESVVGVDLGYSSAVFAIPDRTQLDFSGLACLPEAPKSSRCGYMLLIEHGQWQVLLVGRDADRPPAGAEGYLAYARGLSTTTVASALEKAVCLSPAARFGFPESSWRHFGRMERFPRGLLPLGDAICRFNPVYGQGMSVAAKEAALLRRLILTRATAADSLAWLAQEFLAMAERLIETPWELSALPDFVYPQTRGKRPADLERRLERQAALNRLAVGDPQVHRLLLEVQHLVKPISDLRIPELVERAMTETAPVMARAPVASAEAGLTPGAVPG